MASALDPRRVRLVPAEELTVPRPGIVHCFVDYWWSVTAAGELIFYRSPGESGYGSPQCNSDRRISERLTASLYPEATVQQFPAVFVPVNPADYV